MDPLTVAIISAIGGSVAGIVAGAIVVWWVCRGSSKISLKNRGGDTVTWGKITFPKSDAENIKSIAVDNGKIPAIKALRELFPEEDEHGNYILGIKEIKEAVEAHCPTFYQH